MEVLTESDQVALIISHDAEVFAMCRGCHQRYMLDNNPEGYMTKQRVLRNYRSLRRVLVRQAKTHRRLGRTVELHMVQARMLNNRQILAKWLET